MSDTYQAVTDKVVAALENAQRWEKPWIEGFRQGPGEKGAIFGRPINAVSGLPYRGINVPLLWSAGRASPYWGTYRAWQSKGAQVLKGEKAAHIVFWKKIPARLDPSRPASPKDKRRMIFLAREYAVFNAEQVSGFEAPAPKAPKPIPCAPKVEPIPAIDAWMEATGARVIHGAQDRAYYSPSDDYVMLPTREQFTGTSGRNATESYYGTAFHELGHWTGHPSRLAREFGSRFGNEAYAFEELVAELTAAFLSGDHGLAPAPRQDHANYLASWLSVLRADKRAIFTAASKAELAARFLHGERFGEEEAPEPIAEPIAA